MRPIVLLRHDRQLFDLFLELFVLLTWPIKLGRVFHNSGPSEQIPCANDLSAAYKWQLK